jgi:hypothetical protein
MKFLQLLNIIEVFNYISHAPFFWGSMGLVTGIGMFIGSIIYNGDVKRISKAIITLIVYITLISSMNITRIYDVYCNIGVINPPMAFGATLTSVFVSIFYILGMFTGVTITRMVRKHELK